MGSEIIICLQARQITVSVWLALIPFIPLVHCFTKAKTIMVTVCQIVEDLCSHSHGHPFVSLFILLLLATQTYTYNTVLFCCTIKISGRQFFFTFFIGFEIECSERSLAVRFNDAQHTHNLDVFMTFVSDAPLIK